MAVLDVDVMQLWPFLSVANPHRVWGQAIDTLAFADTPFERVLHARVVDAWMFSEGPWISGDQALSAVDTLRFVDEGFRTRVGYVYQNFVMTLSTAIGPGAAGTQILAFTDSAEAIRVRLPGLDTWTFTESTSLGAHRLRPVSDVWTLADSAVRSSPNAAFNAVPVSPVAIAPTITLGGLVLPAPDFGNTEELGQTRVARNAMGGTFIIFRASGWPTTDLFSLAFSYLAQADCDALRTLAAANVGRLVPYLDHEGNAWTVIITTPEVEVVQTGRNNFTATLKLLVAQ